MRREGWSEHAIVYGHHWEVSRYGTLCRVCSWIAGGTFAGRETIDELNANLAEVIEMLLEDGEPAMESEFIGTQTVQVG